MTAQIQFELDGRRGCANLKGKIDTGAQGSILPIRLYRQMFPEHVDDAGCPREGVLEPSSVTLKAYGGMRIRHFGECTIQCFLGKKSYRANFYVTDTTGAALFGLPLIRGLNLLDLR